MRIVSAISSKEDCNYFFLVSICISHFGLTLFLCLVVRRLLLQKHSLLNSAKSFPSMYPGLAGLTFVSSTVSYHAIILTYNSHTL